MNKEPELVDLGLPSGNLWFKCNLGANTETDPGNYYQFGSLVGYQGEEARKHSTWSTCPFNDGKDYFNEEYFKANRYKLVYKNGNLRPEFDVVTQTYGKGYKIPDSKDFQELLDNTISKVGIKKNGRLFTSKINGKTLFVPFSGYVWNGFSGGVGTWCGLWLGRLDSSDPDFAYNLSCRSDGAGLCYYLRFYSLILRGIKVRDE